MLDLLPDDYFAEPCFLLVANIFNEEFDRYAGGSGSIPGLGFGIDFAGYNRE